MVACGGMFHQYMVLQREVGVGLSEENGQLEMIENATIETDNRY